MAVPALKHLGHGCVLFLLAFWEPVASRGRVRWDSNGLTGHNQISSAWLALGDIQFALDHLHLPDCRSSEVGAVVLNYICLDPKTIWSWSSLGGRAQWWC